VSERRVIWVVDSDEASRALYDAVLGLRFDVQAFTAMSTFAGALEGAPAAPDFVIAELRLDDGSFLDFLADEAASTRLGSVPFMVVSAYDDLDAMRLCFGRGARDYLVKPLGANELRCKIERFLVPGQPPSRRSGGEPGSASSLKLCGSSNFVLDSTSLTVANKAKVSAHLTAKEFQIMSLFERAAGHPLAREQLVARLWGEVKVNEKALDVHISNLRKKIGDLGMTIEFMPPRSYTLLGAGGTLAA
jgi:DNA-binding response OmpR family regulator